MIGSTIGKPHTKDLCDLQTHRPFDDFTLAPLLEEESTTYAFISHSARTAPASLPRKPLRPIDVEIEDLVQILERPGCLADAWKERPHATTARKRPVAG